MTTLTKQKMQALRTDLEVALKAVGEEHGLDLGIGNITFDATTFRTKLTGQLDDLPVEQTKIGKAFRTYAPSFGISASLLGRTVWIDDKPMTVFGWNEGAPKKPVMLECQLTGKQYRATPSHLKALAAA